MNYDHAHCIQASTEIFYDRETQDIARSICAECPIQIMCLDDALARREEHGIWGGATPRQRLEMLRQQHSRHWKWPAFQSPMEHVGATVPVASYSKPWGNSDYCNRGHQLVGDNVAIDKRTGKRRCRQCKRDTDAASARRRRARGDDSEAKRVRAWRQRRRQEQPE